MNDLVPKSLAVKMTEWQRHAKAWKPWPYQERALRFLLEHGQAGLLLEPGLGKTSITLAAFKIFLQKRLMRRALVVAPLRAIYDVWPAEISDWKDFNDLGIAVLHGGGKEAALHNLQPRHQIALINPEGFPWLADRPERLRLLDADTLVIDECFAAGTLITTPIGSVPIEKLCINDVVCNTYGDCRILKITAKPPITNMVEVHLGKRKIVCTEDHPFFTDLGWLPAKCLKDRRVFCLAELFNMWKTLQNVSKKSDSGYWTDLFQILWYEMGVEKRFWKTPQENFQDYEQNYDWTHAVEQEQILVNSIQTQGITVGQESPSYVERTWWQRSRSSQSGDDSSTMSAEKIYLELRCFVGWKVAWLSYQLQSRFWRSNEQTSVGSRWNKSSSSQRQRCKEGKEAIGTWVEGVSYLKPGSVPLIYNLEVEGCPHFEIENCALVHNSSKWKSSTTIRFRYLRRVLPQFKRRYILTGSPRPKNYLDLFSQIYILDRGAALGSFVTHYRNMFFYPTGYGLYEWALLPGADKKINALVAPLVLRLDAKDYLKLPREMERIHRIELPPNVQLEYDAIEKRLMSTLFDAPLTSSAAARQKCCQIANGAMYIDAGLGDEHWPIRERPVKFLHTAKVDALVDLYEELQGEQLLVAIGYHHDVTAIRRALDQQDIPCINGQTTHSQASDYIDRWNKGDLDLMLVHPASAGHALNLQRFNPRHVAFFYIPDDYDHYDQCWRRVWRQGNKAEFVMRHLFITQNTVDVAKLINLRRKGDGQNDFLRAMKEYAEKRYGKHVH